MRGADGREVTSDQATIWRWREAYQNDFAARMHWSVADFQHANHNPVVTVNEPLHFRWFHHADAGVTGTNPAAVVLSATDSPTAVVTPTAAPRLTSYRPIILTVGQASRPVH